MIIKTRKACTWQANETHRAQIACATKPPMTPFNNMMDQWLKTGSTLKRDNSDTGGEGATSSSKMTQNVQLKRKNRKYCDEYLSCGFICRGSEDEQKPQCVLCSEILSNESMMPAKLRRHFETKQRTYQQY